MSRIAKPCVCNSWCRQQLRSIRINKTLTTISNFKAFFEKLNNYRYPAIAAVCRGWCRQNTLFNRNPQKTNNKFVALQSFWDWNNSQLQLYNLYGTSCMNNASLLYSNISQSFNRTTTTACWQCCCCYVAFRDTALSFVIQCEHSPLKFRL